MPRPELLFISQALPFPPDSGVKIRTFHTLKALAHEFPTRVLAFWRRRGFDGPEDAVSAAKSLEGEVGARVSIFPIPMEWSALSAGGVHLRSLAFSRPYTHFAHSVPAFFSVLSWTLPEHDPALIHLDSLDLSAVFGAIQRSPTNARVICTHHNVESELLERRAKAERSRLRRAYLFRQAQLYASEEKRACPAFDLNIAVSERDADRLRASTGARFEVSPNGVDLEYFRPAPGAGRRGVVFVGGSSWFPNRDALEFFSREILPLVRRELPELEVTWVGRCEERDQQHFWEDHRIRLTGYVPDIRPYLEKANCMVVPLRVGGGTRLKVTTSWAAGLPVVGTSIGVEGLKGKEGTHFLVHDDPESLANAIVRLHRRPDLWKDLSEAGRRIAEDLYGWTVIGRELCGHYRSLVSE